MVRALAVLTCGAVLTLAIGVVGAGSTLFLVVLVSQRVLLLPCRTPSRSS